ncbi:S41 family peptidase [Sediminibacterium ginsengisoli]|uniref:Peptidase family S41 n=1 Tax=Sediminibacterium ginsengisoli TaxID=413434 RepID=A0A1T4M813_9BACT|nr:S41 family peptidase [Sediminibacterium ginsengisoli]SJZ62987.1 Peptidase family S41 [Sediminibacterium ginsengisoli]
MKLRPYLILLAFALLMLNKSYCQLPDSIKNHIDSSLLILEKNSLYSKNLNWPKIRQQVYNAAATAKTKAQTFPALKIAFDALGDKHAAYYQFDDQYRLDNPTLMARYSDSIKAAWKKGPRILKQMIGDIAYISIPLMAAGKQEDIDKYANWIYDAVLALQKNNPAGWIVDLRLNGGGNIRPMLAGLAMFFGDGIVSYYIDRNGKATDEAAFKDGDFTIDGVKQATVKNKVPYFSPVKTAVLIGPGTASSGEGVAVVFSQRKHTKLFGQPSAGMANATNGFVFNNQQSYFLISTAYIGNKNKKRLPESIQPDQKVTPNDAFSDVNADLVVKAAVEWLTKK